MSELTEVVYLHQVTTITRINETWWELTYTPADPYNRTERTADVDAMDLWRLFEEAIIEP